MTSLSKTSLTHCPAGLLEAAVSNRTDRNLPVRRRSGERPRHCLRLPGIRDNLG